MRVPNERDPRDHRGASSPWRTDAARVAAGLGQRLSIPTERAPASRSGEYAHDFNEVKELGRLDSSVRTAEQTAAARFWTDHDIPQWNRNLLRLADARGLNSIETARMLAMAHVASSFRSTAS